MVCERWVAVFAEALYRPLRLMPSAAGTVANATALATPEPTRGRTAARPALAANTDLPAAGPAPSRPRLLAAGLSGAADILVGIVLPPVRQAADATPPNRRRVIDAVRGFSLLVVVVLAHGLGIVIFWQPGVGPVGADPIEITGWYWISWAFMVMPWLFAFGGAANAVSWASASASARGVGYSAWVWGRVRWQQRSRGHRCWRGFAGLRSRRSWCWCRWSCWSTSGRCCWVGRRRSPMSRRGCPRRG